MIKPGLRDSLLPGKREAESTPNPNLPQPLLTPFPLKVDRGKEGRFAPGFRRFDFALRMESCRLRSSRFSGGGLFFGLLRVSFS